MIVAVAGQYLQTVSRHPGRVNRFILFDTSGAVATEVRRLDLPKDQIIHGFPEGHKPPLDEMDVLICQEAGDGFVHHMMERGVATVLPRNATPKPPSSALLPGN